MALGSNRRHGRHGAPERVVAAAIAAMADAGLTILAVSPTLTTPPIGPSIRRFANAAALIETALPPAALLARLKTIERDFGRRRGQRWGARVIDLDIILWSGGLWASPTLSIPHRAFCTRDFVLFPLERIAPDWIDPLGNRSIRQLAARLRRRRPVDRPATRP
ncbi:2-amino-4-hydroxy-6-hydroxymethyldihydropteridine diphosphokinase [Sphingomonas colocasiae]|uniref:2-amino-4-hydroxy-6- hydroxymethyldihydropteridine diphosphokinase n=1 Tax=Sphingomonas colocasiae TaxID=1848973 RepID=UPI0031B9D9D4